MYGERILRRRVRNGKTTEEVATVRAVFRISGGWSFLVETDNGFLDDWFFSKTFDDTFMILKDSDEEYR